MNYFDVESPNYVALDGQQHKPWRLERLALCDTGAHWLTVAEFDECPEHLMMERKP